MKYECEPCGYIYDPEVGDPDNGVAPGTAFEDLPDAEKAEEIKNLKNALNFARKVLVTEECDVLILDEVLGLVEAGVIEAEELRALFEAKGEYTSLILTGIYPAKEIWQYADEVTEMVTAYKADSSGQ